MVEKILEGYTNEIPSTNGCICNCSCLYQQGHLLESHFEYYYAVNKEFPAA
jgi:hypothetical protein